MRITVKSGQILSNRKIYYTGETLETSDDAAKLLIARGLADQEGEAAEEERGAQTPEPEKSIEDMTVKELLDYAVKHDIPIDAGIKKKADLIAAIQTTGSGQTGETDTDQASGEEPATDMPEA